MFVTWHLSRRKLGAFVILIVAIVTYAITVQGEGELFVKSATQGPLTPLGPIQFQANRIVESGSLRVDPSVPGETRIDGRTLSFYPADPLRPGATYRFDVTVRAGGEMLADQSFHLSTGLVDTLWVYVKLDTDTHWVHVYHGDELVKSILASGGRPGNETPLGTFRIQNRGHHFWSAKYGEGAYFWVRIYDNYLFHSVPVDIEGNVIPEEAHLLGCPASHGCVRMSMSDAKWFYENVPDGTLVVIDGK